MKLISLHRLKRTLVRMCLSLLTSEVGPTGKLEKLFVYFEAYNRHEVCKRGATAKNVIKKMFSNTINPVSYKSP